MQIAPRPHCEQSNDFFKTVLNPSQLFNLSTARDKKNETQTAQRIIPLPPIESFSNLPAHFQRPSYKLPLLKPLAAETPHLQQETNFGWCCTFEGCNYQQKGRSDVFKAKRHVWDKHLRRTAEYNEPLENVTTNCVAPIYEQLSQTDREKVKVSIFKYLKDQNLETSKIASSRQNSSKAQTKTSTPKETKPVVLQPIKQQQKVQEEEKVEEKKEQVQVEEKEEEEELPKATVIEKKNLCCTWKGCDYLQQEKDIWKAKRHIWDKHLRTSDLYETLCLKNFAPSYGKLNQEEKKCLDGEIVQYIGEKVTSYTKTVTKKKSQSSPTRNLSSIKPRREKRKTSSSDNLQGLEEEQENAYRRKRTRNDDASPNKKRRSTRSSTPPKEEIVYCKITIPDLRPRPKNVPKEDEEKSGEQIWEPSMTNDEDVENLKKFCSIQMDDRTIDFAKVYNIFMQNKYQLTETKQIILSDLKLIQKDKMKKNFLFYDGDCEDDLIKMKNLMEE
eukprot:gene6989-11155_t